jgi:prepilin-type N-terminal cleavage/methylation domain-containing protein
MSKGFSMIEVLVVIGMIVLVGGFALFVSMESYRGSAFRSDRDLLVSVLQHARAQAMNNICLGTCADGRPHGVHIQSDAYTIFQDEGSGYDEDDVLNASFESSTIVVKNPTTLDIIFDQLSGNTSPSTVTLTDAAGHSSTISVNAEGQITWTN